MSSSAGLSPNFNISQKPYAQGDNMGLETITPWFAGSIAIADIFVYVFLGPVTMDSDVKC